jgi:nitroreductase
MHYNVEDIMSERDIQYDVFTAIKNRRSIRKYKNKEVEEGKLKQILEAGHLAPSAKNVQDWRFVIVRDKQLQQALATAARNQTFVGQAPVVIVCCTVMPEYILSCGQPAGVINGAIALDHMTLAAQALGLGTCWIGAFDPVKVRKICNIPESVGIVELLTLGYAAETPDRRKRKETSEVIFFDKWS